MSGAIARRSVALLAFAAIGAITTHRAARAWWPVGAWVPPPTSWQMPPVPVRNRWRSWNPIPIASGVSGFWAIAPNDVWAWGGTEVMRWNGRSWARVDVPVQQTIKAIWGAPNNPNDVWVRAWDHTPRSGGSCEINEGHVDTTLLHWDGRAWSSVERRSVKDDSHDSRVPPAPPPADKASVVDRDKLIALWTRHGDGHAMPPFKSGYWTGDDEIWARTDTGFQDSGYQIGHFDGNAWTVGERLTSGDFCSVRMLGDADGWALSQSPSPGGLRGREPALGGPVRDGLFRWDGRAWRFVRPVPERMHRLWASGPSDVWAIGEAGLVMHWNGARWSTQRLAGDLWSIWGRARDDIWINGCANNFYHWNGSAWSRVPNPVPAGHPGVCPVLWGTSATDVSAFGSNEYLRWNGAAWKYARTPFKDQVPLPYGGSVAALWTAPSSGDLWAVGTEVIATEAAQVPLILRRSAGVWSRLETPRAYGNLLAVWGDRDDDVWAVGTKGLILHWDGTTWSLEESGVVEPLRSIHGAGGTAWIVGDRGTVLVRAR